MRAARLSWSRCGFALLLAWFFVAASAQAAPAPDPGQKTYIEFVFDSSSSMSERAEGRQTRMEVAKAVLNEVIQTLPDRPDVEIALRVYGAQLKKGSGCLDSVLVKSFGPIGRQRGAVIDAVRALTPAGLTPIAYSLEEAAKDFPVRKGKHNIIVLITDGEESCGGKPCQVSARLQDQGFILEPYVVGFAVSEREAAGLKCIGQYYPANDTATLRAALTSILAKAINPATLRIEAWAGGKNVSGEVEIDLVDNTGKVVQTLRGALSDSQLLVNAQPGVYSLRGRLIVGTERLTAQSSGLLLQEGEETRARLDFGDLIGQLLVTARAGGRDVSGLVDIRVTQQGQPIAAAWKGTPPVTPLPAGVYDVFVSLKNKPGLNRHVQATVAPGRFTPVLVDLGDLPGGLSVTAAFGGADITRRCELAVYRDNRLEATYPPGSDVIRHEGSPGTYRLVLRYMDEIPLEKSMDGVALRAGEETQVPFNFDDLPGELRVKVVGGGRDVTSKVNVQAYQPQGSSSLPLRGEARGALLAPGLYRVQATYGTTTSDPLEVQVRPGRITSATIEMVIPGRIEVETRLDDEPLRPDLVDGRIYDGDRFVANLQADDARLTLSVPPGAYRVLGTYSQGGDQVREAEVTVEADMTARAVLTFAAAGKVRFTATVNGKPTESAEVTLYRGEAFFANIPSPEKGVWEAAAIDGLYELRVVPHIAGYDERRFPGLSVRTGETVEESQDYATGLIRVRATVNGKPFKDVSASLYRDGAFLSYLNAVEPGLWELEAAPGIYELRLVPQLAGYEERRLPDLAIRAGETTEKTLDLSQGAVRFRATLNGKPLKDANPALYHDGRFVAYLKVVEPGFWELSAADGAYELRVTPRVAGYGERRFPGLVIKSGETVEKSMALGQGLIRFKATMNNKPLKDASVAIYRDSSFVSYLEPVEPGTWEISAAEDTYELRVTPRVSGYDERRFPGLVVKSGETAERSLTLGQGLIRFRATMNGKPLKDANVAIYRDNEFVAYLRVVEPGVWDISPAQGTYELRVTPAIPGFTERRFPDVASEPGQVSERSLDLGQGKIRFRATNNSQPLKEASVSIYRDDEFIAYLQPVEPGLWEVTAAEGLYEIRVSSNLVGFVERRFDNLDLKAGQTISKSLAFGQGRIRLRATLAGKPLEDATVSLYRNDEYRAQLESSGPGEWTIEAMEGEYSVAIQPELDGYAQRYLNDVVVTPGKVTELTAAFAEP